MYVQFWGVRGSLPSPLLPGQIKDKIAAVLERLTPDDIGTPEDRERFLENLPPWLYGTVGGNSPCLSVKVDSLPGRIVFDAGSGIRELGAAISGETPKPDSFHLFFSHFHWDHVQGLPFFGPGYDPSVSLDFYSPMDCLESALQGQMTAPYFPVHLDAMASKKSFRRLDGQPVRLGDVEITYKKMNHPGDSWAYKVREGNRSFIYATDTELSANDFQKTEENSTFFENTDVIILDSQYTLGEAIEKYNWGHSAFSLGADFAAIWNIKHLFLFHHDPTYDDGKLFTMLQSARRYMERLNLKGIEISLAMEGTGISL